MEQGAFAGLTALSSILFGGLLAKHRLEKIIVFNEDKNSE